MNIKKLDNNALLLDKPIGKTPLEAISDLKQKDPLYKDKKIGYAGRLDPMAEGALLLLVGDENKNKKKYEDLNKTYKIEILIGVSTDTYDILGKVEEFKADYREITTDSINEELKSFEKIFDQEYPPYSSKTVNGKPLYYYARRNLLSEIKIPKRKVEIFKIDDVVVREVKGSDILGLIVKKLSLVNGDFRQEEISKNWQETVAKHKDESFKIITLTVACSSGTYMRSLAYNFGKKIGIPSLAFSIKRISIGGYKID